MPILLLSAKFQKDFCLNIQEGLYKTVKRFRIVLRDFMKIGAKAQKKTARSFFAEIYRSGNAAGDSCKATLWHTQTSA